MEYQQQMFWLRNKKNEPQHEISNNVVCATSKASDQPAHMGSLMDYSIEFDMYQLFIQAIFSLNIVFLSLNTILSKQTVQTLSSGSSMFAEVPFQGFKVYKGLIIDYCTTLVSSLYNSGYVRAVSGFTSLSRTRENTGYIVYSVEYLEKERKIQLFRICKRSFRLHIFV